MDRQAPARARPNGSPFPEPQERPRPAGAPGAMVEEREPRRDRRPPAANAAHLASLVFSLKSHAWPSVSSYTLCAAFAPSPSAPDGSSDASPPTAPLTPLTPYPLFLLALLAPRVQVEVSGDRREGPGVPVPQWDMSACSTKTPPRRVAGAAAQRPARPAPPKRSIARLRLRVRSPLGRKPRPRRPQTTCPPRPCRGPGRSSSGCTPAGWRVRPRVWPRKRRHRRRRRRSTGPLIRSATAADSADLPERAPPRDPHEQLAVPEPGYLPCIAVAQPRGEGVVGVRHGRVRVSNARGGGHRGTRRAGIK